eukprot:8624502-Pyramimonas_sp.AAC.1
MHWTRAPAGVGHRACCSSSASLGPPAGLPLRPASPRRSGGGSRAGWSRLAPGVSARQSTSRSLSVCGAAAACSAGAVGA